MNNTLSIIRQGFKLLIETGRFDRICDKVNILSAAEGKLTAEVVVAHEHTNRGGTLHGGYAATLVDQLSTMALFSFSNNQSDMFGGVSVELNMSYLSAANVGDTLFIEASTLKKGRTMAFLNVDIYNKATMVLVARGHHIKYLASCQPKL